MAARLPNVDAFGARPIPRSNRPVVADRSGEIIGNAVEDAGSSLGRLSEHLSAREDKFNYAKAKSTLLLADIAARKELEADQDWETHETRYRERILKAQESASALIRSSSDRALFEMDASLDLERGAEAIRQQARSIEVDKAMADMGTLLESNRAAALGAKDEATRAAIIGNSLEIINGAREKYGDRFTEIDATKMRQNWTRDYAEAFIMMMPAAERVALLNKPGTEVDFLQPDERAKMLKVALEEDKELRIRSASMGEADRIMEAHGRDRGAALAAAREIKDPEVRDAATSRINARFAEIEAIDADRNEEVFKASAAKIEQGASVRDLDLITWLTILTPAQRQALDQREKQLQSGVVVETDQALWYELRREAANNPAEFVKRDLLLHRPSLSDPDFQSMADLQARIQAADGTADKLLSGIRTSANVVDGALREIGVEYGASASPEQNAQANRFRRMVDDRVLDLQRVTGKEATPEEVQRITDELIVKGEVPGSVLGIIPWSTAKRRFEVEAGEEFAVTDTEDVPAEDRRQIEAALRRRGRPITDSAVLELFNLGLVAQ